MKSRQSQVVLAIVSIIAILGCIRYTISKAIEYGGPPAPTGDKSGIVQMTVWPQLEPPRMPVKSTGTIEVHLKRIAAPNSEVIDVGDQDQLLILENALSRDYSTLVNGKREVLSKPFSGYVYRMLPSGKVVQSPDMTGHSGMSGLSYPYNSESDRSFLYADGSYLSAPPSHTGTLRSDGRPRAGGVGSQMVRSPSRANLYTLVRQIDSPSRAPGEPTVSPNTKFFDRVFQARNQVTIQSVGEGSVWVTESIGSHSGGQDILRHLTPKGAELVKLPKGYFHVNRIRETNGVTVATFGSAFDPQPYRTFMKSKDGWTELPVGTDYTSCFVQQVLADGRVLGFLCRDDMSRIEPVVWKGDRMGFLSKDPAWPKSGTQCLFACANKNGTFVVRSILDSRTNKSEYFALKLQ